MQIKIGKPLIWPIVKFFFDVKWGQVAVTWGNTIYAPGTIDDPLMKHEAIHGMQQKMSKIVGLWWWVKYIISPSFRLSQEIPAHQVQMKEICTIFKDRNRQDRARRQLALFLSSNIYKNMVSFDEAYKLLR